jgi:hypothetical protein
MMVDLRCNTVGTAGMPHPSPVARQEDLPARQYQYLVDRCARERLNYVIANGSPIRARLLIEKLFKIARSDVVIVSGSLRDRTWDGIDVYGYGPIIEAAKTFLSYTNSTLRIIVQKGYVDLGVDENRFLDSLQSSLRGQLILLVPKPGTLPDSVPHFMVTDASSYRIETGPTKAGPDFDSPGMRQNAAANFGDAHLAATLRNYFKDLEAYVSRLPDTHTTRWSQDLMTEVA